MAGLYDLQEWRKSSAAHLIEHPNCVRCGRASEVTDHIEPHGGDIGKFLDRDNWQALCKRCHDGPKKAEERRGFSIGVGLDGWPTDPRHPANEGVKR